MPHDSPLTAVDEALSELGLPLLRINQLAYSDMNIKLSVGSELRGELSLHDFPIKLQEISAIYLRPHPLIHRASIDSGVQSLRHEDAVEEALYTWVALTSSAVVNRPRAMAANGSKPYQLSLIESLGFKVRTRL